MWKQTENLAALIPLHAKIIYEANIEGSHDWQIVRSFVRFDQAKREDWKPIASFTLAGVTYDNRFHNRTEAFRKSGSVSRYWVKESTARTLTEKNHFGVWEMREGHVVFWQTILPIIRIENAIRPSANLPMSYADEVDAEVVYYEGAVRQIKVDAYERNTQARNECIKLHGAQCCVCGFDFGKVYGEIGEGYIHIHHLRPLADIREQYTVDPVTDLQPICPNCHAMLHRRKPPYSIEEMKDILEAELLQTIYQEKRPGFQERFDELNARGRTFTLTAAEQEERLRLVEESEAFTVQRLQALVELAQLRQVSLPALMKQLGIKPPAVV